MSVFTRAPHTESTSVTDLLAGAAAAAAATGSDGDEKDIGIVAPSASPPSTLLPASGPATRSEHVLNRLVVRDLPYHQSSNSLRIRHQSTKPLRFYHWYVEDWFHVLLRLRTAVSVFLFVVIWTSFLVIFAAIYYAVDAIDPRINCGLGVPPNSVTFYTACE
jgi:hypothetical protein